MKKKLWYNTRSHPKTCFDDENENFWRLARKANQPYLLIRPLSHDDVQTTKEPFADQMRFGDGFCLPKDFCKQ